MSATPFSYRQYAGNGSTTTFSVPFPYLLKAHVKVYIGFNILDGTFTSELADGVGFSWTSGTQIQATAAPASGQTLTVIRQTPNTTRLVDWQDGSNLISNDLDTADLQNLYVIQEQQDRNNAGIAKSTQAEVASASAVATATAASATASSAVTTANSAVTAAGAATTTANTAATNASAAVATANTASTNASAAVATANAASSNASTAVTTANAAAASAAAAVSTANSAVSTANNAVTTANNANTTAQAANTTAANAQSIANSALSLVTGVVNFIPVANVAAIPASPSNDDAIQVVDSTGIQSFSPLTGLPAGFTGSPQLYVRLQYNSATPTWEYSGYGPNDPDSRYLLLSGGTLTGQLKADDSTSAAAPVYAFDGDTNTGVAHTGADELALVTGGTARLTIDGSGNVAVPGALTKGGSNVVTVGDTGTVTSAMLADGTIVNADINASAAIAGTKISPDFGSQNVTTTGTATAAALIPSGSGVPTNGVYLPSANNVAISTSSVGRLFIDASGNVGVATSPSAWSAFTALQIQKGSIASTGDDLNLMANAYYDGSAYRRIGTQGVARQYFNTDGSFIWSRAGTGTANSTVTFSEVMRIDSSGRVGIGTTSPDAALTVVGTGKFTATQSLIINGTSGTYSTWQHNGTAVGDIGTGNQVFSGGSTTDFGITARIAASLVFGTNTTERARIDSSGRLLVGTSSQSGGSLLQVNDNRIRIATAKTPASATDTGVAGEICWDANYVYVCTATNTWKRTAISTW